MCNSSIICQNPNKALIHRRWIAPRLRRGVGVRLRAVNSNEKMKNEK